MPRIDDATVLRRAQELCARNGSNWERALRNNRPTIDQAARRNYLALAWEQIAARTERRCRGGRRGEKRLRDVIDPAVARTEGSRHRFLSMLYCAHRRLWGRQRLNRRSRVELHEDRLKGSGR